MTAANNPAIVSSAPSSRAPLGQRLVERIGNTPLLRLERLAQAFPNVEIYAKAEWFNPGGSVKDRAAYSMIREGERRGELRPGKVILDATSGNTGIAYAMIGAALGYRVKLCLPSSASPERKRTESKSFTPQAMKEPTAPFDVSVGSTTLIQRSISTRTNMGIPRIRQPITRVPPRRYGFRPRGELRTLWLAWVQAARSSAPHDG